MSEDEPPLPSDFVAPDAPAPPPSVPALPPHPPRANDDDIVVNRAVTFLRGTIFLDGMTRSEFTGAQATLFSAATSAYIKLAAGSIGVTLGETKTTDNGFSVEISVLISELDDKHQAMAKLLDRGDYLQAVQSYLPRVTELGAQNVREENVPLSSGDNIVEEDMKEYGGLVTGILLFLFVACPFVFTCVAIFAPDGKFGRFVQIVLGEGIFNRLRKLFCLEPRYAHAWMPKSLA